MYEVHCIGLDAYKIGTDIHSLHDAVFPTLEAANLVADLMEANKDAVSFSAGVLAIMSAKASKLLTPWDALKAIGKLCEGIENFAAFVDFAAQHETFGKQVVEAVVASKPRRVA